MPYCKNEHVKTFSNAIKVKLPSGESRSAMATPQEMSACARAINYNGVFYLMIQELTVKSINPFN